MKKYMKYFIIIVALAGAGFLAFTLFGSAGKTSLHLQTITVQKGSVTNSVTATGTVEPVDQVEVGTQVSGLVYKIYVDYNSTVKKGQLLAELDKTNLNESVSNAQALYTASLNELNFYQQNFSRQKSMYKSGVISKADYETASYQVKNAQATVAQRKTTLIQAQTNLQYANVYSPIDGVVITKDVEEGQTVAASMTTPTLFTIAKDITKMQVEADVDEADIGGVKEGQRVSFTVDAFPNQEFSGKVRQVRLGATTTSNVVTYTVIIDADNPDQQLKPGLTATITIYTKEVKDVLTIPTQALQFVADSSTISKYYKQQDIQSALPSIQPTSPNVKYVWIRKADGSLEQKQVTTTMTDGVNTSISAGLKEGDQVVTSLEEASPTSSGTGNAGSSPFMPKMPSRNNKKAGAQ